MTLVQIAIAGVLLAGLVLTWFLTRRRYVQRLAQLNLELDRIAAHREYSQRVTEGTRDDEMSRLQRRVNDLFDALAADEYLEDEREALLRNLAESAQEAILVVRAKVLYANPRAAALRGIRQEDLIGKSVLEIFHPDDRERAGVLLKNALTGDQPLPPGTELQMVNRDGQRIWVEASTRQIPYGGKAALVLAAFDVTSRKQHVEALARERDRASTTLHSIADGVITTDAVGRIDYMNNAAERLLGRELGEARGKSLVDLVKLVDEADRKRLPDPVAQALERKSRVNLGRRAVMLVEGEEYSIELSVAPLSDDTGVQGTVIVLHDVTELRGLARQMSYQASHDALTGLINKREFERRLEDALAGARAESNGHVLCYMDLDRFKAVNDTCGHMAGDKMLREVSGLIRDKVRDSDTVARLGGDEFGMLLMGCPLDKARQIADDVCQAVEDYRFVWRDRIFQIGISIGLIEISSESGSVVDVMSAADSACYIAKQGRTRVHVYSARDESVARHKGEIAWLQRLQHALREDRFELNVQPIVSVDGNVPDGPAAEVLVRMLDEHNNLIEPSEFIVAAERYQLMPRIDRWVVKTAFAALGSGGLRLPDNRSLTINLSGQTIGDSQFLEYVVECLDATGIAPDRVCFELTESSVSTNIGHARRFIEVLHGMGCRFALDDFGSGVGSLANLRDLSMDFIKIHGSYVRKLAQDSVSQAMVSAMIELARSLNIRVVAEQVEDSAALEAVRDMGVDFVQGYAIGRPRPLAVSRAA